MGRPHKAGSCVACGVKPLLIRRDEENVGLLCHEISSCSMRGAKSQLSERYLRVFSFPPFAPSMRKICSDLHWCRRLPTKRVSTEGKAGGLNNSWHRKRFLSSRRQKCEVITCMSAIQLVIQPFTMLQEGQGSHLPPSRVLNGNYPVSARTRRRVEAALAETGYSPNQIARSLSTRSTRVLGVLGTDLTNPYFVEVMAHIQRFAGARGLQLMSENAISVSDEASSLRMLLDRRVDGIIMIARNDEADDTSPIVEAAKRVPLVLIGYPSVGQPVMSVRAREEDGMFELVRQLVTLGHRRFLFLGGGRGVFPPT